MNSPGAASVGKVGFSFGVVTLPSETSVFCCYVSCVTGCNNSKTLFQHNQYLNTGRIPTGANQSLTNNERGLKNDQRVSMQAEDQQQLLHAVD